MQIPFMLLLRSNRIAQLHQKSKRVGIKTTERQISFAADVDARFSRLSLVRQLAGSYKEFIRVSGGTAELQSRKLSYQRMSLNSKEGMPSSPGGCTCDARSGEGVNHESCGGQPQLM
jgi:hypothetical protein